MADDLTPSDAIRLGREQVIGFAIESGGRTSHTTIIARSLNIPAVAGLIGVTSLLRDEAPIIVDGETGTVILHPDAECSWQYRRRKAEIAAAATSDLLATRELRPVTRDGVEVQLMANIDLPEEVDEVPLLRRRRRRPLPQRVPLHREEPAACRPRRSTSRSTAGWSRSRRRTRRSSAPTTWEAASWRAR